MYKNITVTGSPSAIEAMITDALRTINREMGIILVCSQITVPRYSLNGLPMTHLISATILYEVKN